MINRGKRVMIIEDDEDMLEILSIVFQDEGYNVIASNNSDVAANIAQYGPDVVLLDVALTGSRRDGLQICNDIKGNVVTSRLPVVLISAGKNLPEMAEECGADAYLAKPFEIGSIVRQVNSLLSA